MATFDNTMIPPQKALKYLENWRKKKMEYTYLRNATDEDLRVNILERNNDSDC